MMRPQRSRRFQLSLISLAGLFITTGTIAIPQAHADAGSACFDFSKVVKTPLAPPKALPKKSGDATSSGLKADQKTIWGAARGLVKKPIARVYALTQDHFTFKDRNRVKLKVYPQAADHPGYDQFDLVMVSLDTPIQTVQWEEDWGYFITQGSASAPAEIVISYQKTQGTSFIPHLCGSIVLRAVDAATTEVTLYEEVNALGKRSPSDTVKGHLGTLQTLRK